MTARVLPFTHKSAAIYDAAVAQTMLDCGSLFASARAVKFVQNTDELPDGISDDDHTTVTEAHSDVSGAVK